jgi:hypothetical protein
VIAVILAVWLALGTIMAILGGLFARESRL